jgi:hypothetical protein
VEADRRLSYVVTMTRNGFKGREIVAAFKVKYATLADANGSRRRSYRRRYRMQLMAEAGYSFAEA